MNPAQRPTHIRPQVVGALLTAHHRSTVLSRLWVRLRYRPNAAEAGMAAREYLKALPRNVPVD